MNSSLLGFVIPSIIAGAFAIATAILAARLSRTSDEKKFSREHTSDEKKFSRELERNNETLRRDFAVQYASAAATNGELANALRQQFSGAFLWIGNPEQPAERHFIPTSGRLVIGRGRNCDICIFDTTLSINHAVIEMVDGVVFLTDLRSTNGTFVADNRITETAELADGASIRFGNTEARLHHLSMKLAADRPIRS